MKRLNEGGTSSSSQSCESHPHTLTHTLTLTPFTPSPPSPLPRIPDGDLIDLIVAENDLTEGVAVGYLSQLLSAVDTLHQLNIAHMDIRVSHMTVT